MAIKIDWSLYPDRERKALFTQKLTPESPYKSAGVSVIEVKKIAKTLNDDDIELNYLEDILLKGVIIASRKESFKEKRKKLEAFYPLFISWMATDSVAPSLYISKKDKKEAYEYFINLTLDKDPMTSRFAFVVLMGHFLSDDTVDEIMEKAVLIKTDHYLLKMGIAWLTSSCYIHYPDKTSKYFSLLDKEISKMAKQKCRDSKRVIKENKEKLLTL